MKKLTILFAALMITMSLSAKNWHKPTAEDIEVFKTLMELKSGGDILLPQIYVIAYANQQDTLGIKAKQQTREQKRTPQLDENGDPIMIQKRTRTNDGPGTITRAEKREMNKQNCDQAKPKNRTGARPPMNQGTTPPRMGTMQRGGKR